MNKPINTVNQAPKLAHDELVLQTEQLRLIAGKLQSNNDKLDIQVRHSIGQSRINKFMLVISMVALVVTSYAVMLEVESKGELSTKIFEVIKATRGK